MLNRAKTATNCLKALSVPYIATIAEELCEMYIIKDIVRGKSPILTENAEPNIFAKIVALNIFCQ